MSPYALTLKDKAMKNDAASAYNLALCFHEGGKDCPQSDTEAAKWLDKAANLGDVAALVNLGDFYHMGLGVKQDDVKALHYYSAAASHGSAEAEYNIGTFYANGYGLKAANMKEAMDWLTRAANQGLFAAQMDLAHMYMQNQPPSYEDAYFWFAVAANSKDDQAPQAATMRDRIGKALTGEQVAAQQVKAKAWRATPEPEGYDQRRGALH
jgi:TPR repeat protein